MNHMPSRSLSLPQSNDISHKPRRVPLPVVAVDKDKNSQQAMKWAVDHLLINTNSIILVHVRTQPDLLNSRCHSRWLPCNHKNRHHQLLIPPCRKFMNPDVPTCLIKGAPEFCGVYVIYKGKPLTIRTAKVPAPANTSPPKQQMTLDSPYRQAEHFDYSIRSATENAIENAVITKYRYYLPQYYDYCNDEILEGRKSKGVDWLGTDQARELQKLKIEEARRIEELRQSEEAALALVELEKAKCKAAMEAAEAAQKIAELEARRRYNAELKARREAKERKKATESVLRSEIHYRKYSIDEIEVATNFFSSALKVGEGGYGPVFRATLDHTQVAIKVLRPDASQGRKQFQQEVEILSCIRHPNMVLLLGACPEYGCLVYEYMDYGSLEDRLLRRGNTTPIPWATRFKIAAEIATALLFLHQTKPEPLVHRDLKPANILLDHNYVSKISDVGLARLVPASVADSVTQYRITSTAGTLCYIDPEYQQTGMLGVKSDIYSLGIMLLQIITAKPPMSLTHHVERSIEKGNFADMLDPAIKDWPAEETLAFAKLALKCAELRRKDRPDLGKVVLPELMRLRSIGQAYKASRSNNSSNLGAAPKTFDSISKGAMSLIHQSPG
ncbi:hypothetical protein GW17_00017088 [Ensete ventricosum]|nr:hypothetical protein GW17_00017088 [Ensete ventricosum]